MDNRASGAAGVNQESGGEKAMAARENIVWGGRLTRGQARRAAEALEAAGQYETAAAFRRVLEIADRDLGTNVARMAGDETVIWGS